MNTLSGDGEPPHSFTQSLHLWGFLFPCARKVVLLVSMKANYFPYRLCTLEWMCVSKCEYSLYALQVRKCLKWGCFHRGVKEMAVTDKKRLIFLVNCVLVCHPGGQKSQFLQHSRPPQRPKPLPQRGNGVSHTLSNQKEIIILSLYLSPDNWFSSSGDLT